MAARHAEHDALWSAIRKVIDMDPETVDGRFLGCSHERFVTSARNVSSLLDQHPLHHPRQKQVCVSSATAGTATSVAPVARCYDPNKKVSVVAYNMERFAQGCVDVFCELSGYAKNKLGTAPTPFLDESNGPLTIVDGEPTKPKKRCVFGDSWDP